jgi:hypothetical protein
MRPGPVSGFSAVHWTNGLYRAECEAGDGRVLLETEALSRTFLYSSWGYFRMGGDPSETRQIGLFLLHCRKEDWQKDARHDFVHWGLHKKGVPCRDHDEVKRWHDVHLLTAVA